MRIIVQRLSTFQSNENEQALGTQKDLKVNITCPAGHKMHWMCLHSSIDESQPVCYLSLIQSCQWQGWVVKCNKAHLTKWTAMLSNSTPEHQLNSIWNKFLGWFHLGKGKGLCSILSRVKWVQLQTWKFITIPSFYNPLALNKCFTSSALKKEQPRKTKTETKNPLCRNRWCLQSSRLPQDIKRTEYQWWRTVGFVLVSQRILLISKDSKL